MARADRIRYENEKAAYKGPWKILHTKNPDAPKKPMSAFLAFSNERRGAVAQANPQMNGTEISCLLSKLWKECPKDVKQQYREKEAKERQAFKKVRAEWEEQQKIKASDLPELKVGVKPMPTQHPVIDEQNQYNGRCSNVPTQESNMHQHYGLCPDVSAPESTIHQHYGRSSDVPAQESKMHRTTISASPCLQAPANSGFAPMSAISHPSSSITSGVQLPEYPNNRQPSRFNQNIGNSRFENYTMEDILQDDELFEDFSPFHVPNLFDPQVLPSVPTLNSDNTPNHDNADTQSATMSCVATSNLKTASYAGQNDGTVCKPRAYRK